MATSKRVDEAYGRYDLLRRLIDAESKRSSSNPLDNRYFDLGLIEVGDNKAAAARKISQALSDLSFLIEKVAILEMTAAVEYTFRQKFSHVVGQARKSIASYEKQHKTDLYGEGLIKTLEDFQGIKSVTALITSSLSSEVCDALEITRESRNEFAHGADLRQSTKIGVDDARDNLLEVVRRL